MRASPGFAYQAPSGWTTPVSILPQTSLTGSNANCPVLLGHRPCEVLVPLLLAEVAGREMPLEIANSERSKTSLHVPVAQTKGGGPPPALIGPGLTPKETARALEHRPRDADGHYQCWDFFSNRGCRKTDCSLSHKGSVKWKTLDYAIKLQLLRRGGLRGSRKQSSDELVKEMTSLRSLEAQDQAAKVQEGGGRRRPGRKATRAGEAPGAPATEPPSDPAPGTRAGELAVEAYVSAARSEPGKDNAVHAAPAELCEAGYTLQEEGLRKLVQGADYGWYEDQDQGRAKAEAEDLPSDYESPNLDLPGLTRAMKAVEALLASQDPPLANMPDLLTVFVRNYLLHDNTPASPQERLQACFRVAATLGGPELASQAADYLESTQRLSHAGSVSAAASVGRISWDGDIGFGTFEYDGTHWRQFDYQDRLPLSPDLQALLGRSEPEEPKQCMLLHVAAGVLATEGELPTLAAAQSLGQTAREAMYYAAREVEAQLGPPPEYLTRAEADFRVFNHDLLHFGHDRDYRTLVAYPQPCWEHLTFGVWRVAALSCGCWSTKGTCASFSLPRQLLSRLDGSCLWLAGSHTSRQRGQPRPAFRPGVSSLVPCAGQTLRCGRSTQGLCLPLLGSGRCAGAATSRRLASSPEHHSLRPGSLRTNWSTILATTHCPTSASWRWEFWAQSQVYSLWATLTGRLRLSRAHGRRCFSCLTASKVIASSSGWGPSSLCLPARSMPSSSFSAFFKPMLKRVAWRGLWLDPSRIACGRTKVSCSLLVSALGTARGWIAAPCPLVGVRACLGSCGVGRLALGPALPASVVAPTPMWATLVRPLRSLVSLPNSRFVLRGGGGRSVPLIGPSEPLKVWRLFAPHRARVGRPFWKAPVSVAGFPPGQVQGGKWNAVLSCGRKGHP